LKVWVCVTKPGNWRKVRKWKVFGLPRNAARIVRFVEEGDILLIYALRPMDSVVGVYGVKRVLKGTKGVWEDKVYPFGIEIRSVKGFAENMKPISLGYLIGHSNRDVEILPFLKGVPMFEVAQSVLERLRHVETSS